MSKHPSRVRVQPARQHLSDQRWSIAKAAAKIGVPEGHLRCAIYGVAAPNDVVRAKLPDLLGVPLDELFDAELLARRWSGTNDHNSAARRERLAAS